MPPYASFLKLYWTDLTIGQGKVISDPVRVEFFAGPRTYEVFMRVSPPVVRAGVQRTIATQQRLDVEGGRTYVELIARTTDSFGRRQYCEDSIDRVVAQLSAILSPALFAQEVWSGWLSTSEQVLGDMWIMSAPPIEVNTPALQQRVTQFRRTIAQDKERDRRFTLMSKFFARAIATPPGEERFLWLWTVLEVFPMQDTTNIKPIGDHLGVVVDRSANEIKERLGIGQLFGARSHLVHHGQLPYTRDQLGPVLRRLEAIDLVVLRSLGGSQYAGELDEYLQ
jgi:hypothetical protein